VYRYPSDKEEEFRAARRLPVGAIVRLPKSGGAAEAAGLVSDDVIVAIEGRPIASFTELAPSLAGRQAGEWVSVGVVRKGMELTFDIVLASPSGW
jgi:S1-C subfamily serine protease